MLNDTLNQLPETDRGVVVVLSGGMDSTISMRLCVEKYGPEKVHALTFDYGQRQKIEVIRASESTGLLGVQHTILDLSILGQIGQGYSANVDRGVQMPTIYDVLGDPAPKTEVPNRNMILLSLAGAYAQTRELDNIVCGLQVHDEYSYWDTTQKFVDSINTTLAQNRKTPVKVIAPFSKLSKQQELEMLWELDGNLNLLKHTITCYDPDESGYSCGKCPSCSERIMNFAKFGQSDVIPYSVGIPWDNILQGAQ